MLSCCFPFVAKLERPSSTSWNQVICRFPVYNIYLKFFNVDRTQIFASLTLGLLSLWLTSSASPRYEIACFLMRRKQADRIQFLPVQESILWVLVYLAVSTNWATFYVLQRYDFFHWSDVSGVIGIALVIALQALVIYPPLFWIMNQILYDISLLPEQLRDFNIEAAQQMGRRVGYSVGRSRIHEKTRHDFWASPEASKMLHHDI